MSGRAPGVGLLLVLVALALYPKVGLVAVPGTYIPVRIDDLLVAILGVIWLVSLWSSRRLPSVPRPIAVTSSGWLAVGLVSLLLGGLGAGSVPFLTGLAYWAKPIEYLLLGWISYDLVRHRDVSPRSLLLVVMTAALVVIAYGLLESVQLVPRLPGQSAAPGIPTSTIGDVHELAGYLALVVIVAMATWRSWGARARVAILALAAGGPSVIFFTGVRSEYLALAGCLVLVAAVSRSSRLVALASVVVMAALLVWPIVFSAGESSNVATRLTDSSLATSLSIRFEQKWPRLINAGLTSPVVGLGPSAAGEAADGYYVRAFVETGVLGLVMFAALIGSTVILLLRRIALPPPAGDLALAMIIGTTFVGIVGVLIDIWVASRVMELYWPLVGVALAGAGATASGTVGAPGVASFATGRAQQERDG